MRSNFNSELISYRVQKQTLEDTLAWKHSIEI